VTRPLVFRFRGTDWFRIDLVNADGVQRRLLARARRADGRVVVSSLVIVDQEIGPGTLKAIPMSKIENELNRGNRFAALPERSEPVDPDEDLRQIYLALHAHFGFAASPEDAEAETETVAAPDGRSKLARPDGSDPEGFYRQVATAYNEALRETSKVAVVLAEEAEVPVPTVHRWIREARRRGLLPPARQGRAG
jgi:hypothetical protein